MWQTENEKKGYVPKHLQNAAYKIFHWPFEVAIPQGMVQSDEEIAVLGTFTTGNPEQDREMMQQPFFSYVTIDAVVEWQRRGINVEFANPRDFKKIYDIIVEHLQDLALAIRNGWMTVAPPAEDLELLELVASRLYVKARAEIISDQGLQEVYSFLTFQSASPLGNALGGMADRKRKELQTSEHQEIVTSKDLQVLDERIKPWMEG